MKTVKDIRIQSGLSLTELAEYIGISRRTLSRAERGGYTFSTQALLRLARVDACLQEERKTSILSVSNDYDITRLQRTIKQLSSLQDQLSDLEKTDDHNQRIYHLLFSLEQQANDDDKTWINMMHAKISKKLHACEALRGILKERIYLLCAQADYISQTFEKNQSTYEDHISNNLKFKKNGIQFNNGNDNSRL